MMRCPAWHSRCVTRSGAEPSDLPYERTVAATALIVALQFRRVGILGATRGVLELQVYQVSFLRPSRRRTSNSEIGMLSSS